MERSVNIDDDERDRNEPCYTAFENTLENSGQASSCDGLLYYSFETQRTPSLPAGRSKLAGVTSRGTQTILASRGLISLSEPEASTPTTTTATTTIFFKPRREYSAVELAEATTQATPAHPSAAELPRASTRTVGSFGSSMSVPRNEIITLTTDYDTRTPDSRSLTVQVAITRDVARPPSTAEFLRRGDSPPPTLFYEPPIPRQSWRFLPCCRGDEYDADRSVPPTYSVLFPPTSDPDYSRFLGIGSSSTSGHVPVLFENHSSFVARTPPPSYAQAQGICVAYSLERLVSNSASDGRMWSPRSTTAVCPRCATLVITVVDVQQATVTHITACALFLMGCWPCCLLPYCIDSCKKSHHYCPFCRTYLGTYTPW